MPDTKKPAKSNADRGLERHVNPADPTGPLLDHLPKATKATINKKPSKPVRAKTKGKPPTNSKPRK